MIDVSDLIGISYKEHGRNKSGFDCYGLAMEVEKRFGIDLPDFDYTNHSDMFFERTTQDCLAKYNVKRIPILVEGALILFENSKGQKNHIGVYIGDEYVIHCNKNGVHLTKINNFVGKKEVFLWQK